MPDKPILKPVMAYAVQHWPIFLFLAGLGWSAIDVYFDVNAQAGQITKIDKSIEKLDKKADVRQQALQKELREQALRNGTVQANQETMQRMLRDLLQETRRRNTPR